MELIGIIEKLSKIKKSIQFKTEDINLYFLKQGEKDYKRKGREIEDLREELYNMSNDTLYKIFKERDGSRSLVAKLILEERR